ncbi:helix-turn-helix domain-containing protein [Vagococcus intermedius]|uniref:Helix-turn-helix domain-containing protein n=1 Tax=Vagococcus intermedius TaxID=2991418 RepID=A0AAF0CUE1_9ENTE|nr:helix-turn-helix domain-containing protein [Vagococcus intermedius]WEG73085.1 helix-turn-helix domain-containing protein [Vagococcus intermedius]WEG75169.1 helix-turn-helix domain-containing protein [Vagococcus intermedius]
MLDLLLKKNEYMCLTLFESLAQNNRLEKTELLDQLTININTFSRYIDTINSDLRDIVLDSPIFIRHTSELVEIIYEGSLSFYTIYCRLAHLYLDVSNSYRLICSLLQKNKQHTHSLLLQLNLSKSYLNKLIARINVYIKRTQIKISQRNGEIFFYGPETHIIFFEFLMQQFISTFSLAPSENSILSSDIMTSPKKIAYYHADKINEIRLNEVQKIFKKRYYSLHKINIPNPYIKPILTIMLTQTNLVNDFFTIMPLTEDTRLFANLIPRLLSSRLDSSDTRHAIVQVLLEENNTMTKDLVHLTQKLVDNFIPNLDTSQDIFYDFLYVAHLHTVYLALLNFDIKSLFANKHSDSCEFTDANHPLYTKLVSLFEDPKTCANMSYKARQIITNNKKIFIDACYTVIRSFQHPVLKLSLDFINNLSFEYFLQNRLNNTFNRSLEFVQDIYQSDLIISDHLVTIPYTSHFFSFINTHSSKKMSELHSLITVMLNNKALSDDYTN